MPTLMQSPPLDCPLPGQFNYANHLPGSCKHLIFVKYYLEEKVASTSTV